MRGGPRPDPFVMAAAPITAERVAIPPAHVLEAETSSRTVRPEVRGKFLYVGGRKFYARGATYGAFEPNEDGVEYHDTAKIRHDFEMMRAHGFNAVRIPHTMPPRHLLDIAQECGLHVMVGLSAEQWVGYLIDKADAPDIAAIVRSKVEAVAGHPALLCYALGNEIPASSARWIGRKPLERYLRGLYDVVRDADPEGLVTYVNYPSTEYLDLPFLDLLSFNVYLEGEERLQSYIGRLHTLAGDRPLIMSELGLDAMRNGEDRQAHALTWQVQSVFRGGCAGAFVFSWTDEWCRAGEQVDDWAFGLTDIARNPKPALGAVARAFREVPFPQQMSWPRVSVVVCAYNAEPTIAECLRAAVDLEYPDFEVIVVDDGSTDATAEIAAHFAVRLVSTANHGLSSARNTGLEMASGDIVAYLDSDAWPDPHWLQYLAWTYITTDAAGVGGPNIPPDGDGAIADAVSHSPGGPIHVLLTDDVAEHIPGCNMSFRRSALLQVGGCDPQFRTAGDDVDLCWRVQEAGHTIRFNPAAVVWHHRRNSAKAYYQQQVGYGRAEALLEAKWPERYNGLGHLAWEGRLYGAGRMRRLRPIQRIYHGTWGSAPFQFLYEREPDGVVGLLSRTPEWWLVVALLAGLTALGAVWQPLLWAAAPLGAAILLPLVHAWVGAIDALRRSPRARLTPRALLLTAALHTVQPLARLSGRLRHGLTPWRLGRHHRAFLPRRRERALWCEEWIDPQERLRRLYGRLRERVGPTFMGGDYDNWDMTTRAGLAGNVKLAMAVEDHGAGTQYVRVRQLPSFSASVLLPFALTGAVGAIALFVGSWIAGAVLVLVSVAGTIGVVRGVASVSAGVDSVVREFGLEPPRET